MGLEMVCMRWLWSTVSTIVIGILAGISCWLSKGKYLILATGTTSDLNQ